MTFRRKNILDSWRALRVAENKHVIIEQTTFSTIFSTTSSNGSAQFNSFQLSNWKSSRVLIFLGWEGQATNQKRCCCQGTMTFVWHKTWLITVWAPTSASSGDFGMETESSALTLNISSNKITRRKKTNFSSWTHDEFPQKNPPKTVMCLIISEEIQASTLSVIPGAPPRTASSSLKV